MMTMEMLKRVAPKYGLACLLHEKPFAGVNGSGKHLNWSMSDELGNNLLNPGDTPHDNVQFLVFCTAMLRAVNKFQGLLRFSIASAGNDHRLGANEAPPAILSIFLGDMLTDIFEQIEKGAAKTTKSGGTPRHRRRRPAEAPARRRRPEPHQPVRVHGQQVRVPCRFGQPEYRLPEHRAQRRRQRGARLHGDRARKGQKEGKPLADAVKTLLTKMIKENKRIIFNGNNYSDEWQKEAAKRGLQNLRTSVDAYPELMKPDVVKAFEKYNVLNEREVRARYDVALEQYNKTINIEAQLMVLMANRYILPAAYRYQGTLAATVASLKAAGATGKGTRSALDNVTALVNACKTRVDALQELLEHDGSASAEKHAKFFRDKVIPAMVSLRESGDAIECIAPQDVWPLPTYREMLFVR